MARVAVVLFNLGGPDRPEAVRPFLFNLFNDPAIIGAPGPIRWLLARLISWRRAPVAREIYAHIGGKSPLLAETNRQAEALAAALSDVGTVQVFSCMRYWHPFSRQVVQEVQAFEPDEVILLPLYPQFSTATSESSLTDWRRAAAVAGLTCRSRSIGCYPIAPGWVEAQAQLISQSLAMAAAEGPVRLLLSAHGLPKRVVAAGDPYQWQVEQTCSTVMARLSELGWPDLDHVVCYQSRVGPLEWIGPATDDEIRRAGSDGVGVVIAPIAFVSEHSETLVELDIEYRHLAEACGVRRYERVATVGSDETFIGGLAELVRSALQVGDGAVMSQTGKRLCPERFSRCICDQTTRSVAA